MSHIFLSYSRQELTFTDSFVHHLKRHQYDVWVDFRRLVPGHPWQEQINEALDGASALLLVVSKASIDSQAVRHEWERALARNCRVILLIFEAVPLPGSLQQCEWVDFRGRFSVALRQLEITLSSPVRFPETPASQNDFRMPPVPTLFYYLTWVTALMSLVCVLPAIRLLRLPSKVRRRRYMLYTCRVHLGVLTLMWFGVLGFIQSDPVFPLHLVLFMLNCIPLLMLVLLQYSEAMYRWGGPGGTPAISGVTKIPLILRLSNYMIAIGMIFLSQRQTVWSCLGILTCLWLIRRAIYRRWLENIASPPPMHYQIQASNTDNNVVDEIALWMERAGHTRVVAPQKVTHTMTAVADEADYLLVILSSYNTMPKINLHGTKARVYPIIIESLGAALNNHDMGLIQWIDLRWDVPNRIPLLARFIDQPDKLMDYLGVLPSRQIKRPWTVELAYFALTIQIIGNALNLIVLIVLGIIIAFSLLRNNPGAGITLVKTILACLVCGFFLRSIDLLRDRLYSRSYAYTDFMRDFIRLVVMNLILSLLTGANLASMSGLAVLGMLIVVILNRKVLRLWLWPGT